MKNPFKKIVLVVSVFATAVTACAVATNEMAIADDLFEDKTPIEETQNAKNEAKNELKYLSEYQVKFASALLNQVFMKHLRENNLNQHLTPAVINETPYLLSVNYTTILQPDDPENLRRFSTHEFYQLKQNETINSLFENLNLLNNYREGDKSISLDQAKDALAELSVLFGLETSDVIKVGTSSNTATSLIDNSYDKVSETLNGCFSEIKKVPNVKGEMLINPNSSTIIKQQVIDHIADNLTTLQILEPELEK